MKNETYQDLEKKINSITIQGQEFTEDDILELLKISRETMQAYEDVVDKYNALKDELENEQKKS